MVKVSKKQIHKNCPFCGCKACAINTNIHGIREIGGSWWIVECNKCRIRTPVMLSEEECWKVWNKRIEE